MSEKYRKAKKQKICSYKYIGRGWKYYTNVKKAILYANVNQKFRIKCFYPRLSFQEPSSPTNLYIHMKLRHGLVEWNISWSYTFWFLSIGHVKAVDHARNIKDLDNNVKY